MASRRKTSASKPKPGKRRPSALVAISPQQDGLPPRPEPAVSRRRGAITYDEFVVKARDLSLPERELRPFMTVDRTHSRPFRPAMHLDPALVRRADGSEIRAEGAMDWANGLSRWRRQQRFRQRKQNGDKDPVLVSEGDSWFQFPILIDDVVDQLADAYLIWSVDAAGDTLQNMVSKNFPEYLTALRETPGTRAFLFSGGGNDLVGEDSSNRSMLEQVLRPYKKGQSAAWYVDTEEYEKTLFNIESSFRSIISRVAKEYPGLPVIIHGYDYSIPGPAPQEWRKPTWASVDQWLGRAFRTRGILDHALQGSIIKKMIDDLNELQKRLCGEGMQMQGKYKDAYHVDVRGTLKAKDWADELHPTDSGFVKVAARFRAVLSKIGI